jgi:conjugal transfer mating pair stabilization protein TraN
MKRLLVALLLAVAAISAIAGDCRKTGQVCVDSTPSKVYNGITVSISQVGGCWEYEDTYQCIPANYADFCSGIRSYPGCYQTNSVCQGYLSDGTCSDYLNTFRCGSNISPPSGTIQLNTSYTITTDTINRAQCASYESNPSCTLAQRTCTQPGGYRNINGLSVYKDCWEWQEQYTCIAQNYHDYCTPLRQTSGCVEIANTCKSYAWNNSCNEYERTFRCDNNMGNPLPTNVTYLNTEYTLIKDNLNTSQCDPNKSNPNCILSSHTCTQPGGTRNINGLNVYKDCWEWTDEYSCAANALKSDCDDLKNNPACSETGKVCVTTLPSGQCGLLEHKYTCKVKDGSTKEITTCDNGICANGICSGPTTNPDTDFGKAVAGMEIVREMAVYMDPATMQLFKGSPNSCSVKLGGAADCCKAKAGGGGSANNYMIQGVKMFGNEAIRYAGSTYMYDALFQSDLVTDAMLSALYGGGSGSSYTFGGSGGVGFYGVTFSMSASGEMVVAFDPTSFAIAVAVQVITKYASCSPTEQALGMKKDQRLCTYVGSWCSKKVLGACVEKREGYCCYNSRLARIFNEQGRTQIGKTYGDPATPNCSGFTLTEIQNLDFSKMDLSEFISEITPKDLNPTLFTNRATGKVQSGTNNYFKTTP